MNPGRMLGTIAFGSHERAQLIGACRSERDLLVAGRQPVSIREDPYLEEFDRTVGAVVEFAVNDSRSGRHHLDFPGAQHRSMPHAVLMS